MYTYIYIYVYILYIYRFKSYHIPTPFTARISQRCWWKHIVIISSLFLLYLALHITTFKPQTNQLVVLVHCKPTKYSSYIVKKHQSHTKNPILKQLGAPFLMNIPCCLHEPLSAVAALCTPPPNGVYPTLHSLYIYIFYVYIYICIYVYIYNL